jgi:hypothetical protein
MLKRSFLLQFQHKYPRKEAEDYCRAWASTERTASHPGCVSLCKLQHGSPQLHHSVRNAKGKPCLSSHVGLLRQPQTEDHPKNRSDRAALMERR